MRVSLEGCWEKLRRAEEQLNLLESEGREFVEGESHDIAQEPKQRPDFSEYRFTGVKPVPLRFGVIVGEVVHDIRSTLDHLIWQLARWNGKPPHPKRGFPICELAKATGDDRHAWNRDSGPFRPLLHPDHLAIIESLQPYKRRNGPRGHHLFILDSLWNSDKHRVITSALMNRPKEFPARIEADLGGYPGVRIEYMWHTGSVKNRAKALQLWIREVPWGTPPHMHVTLEAPIGIKFGKRGIGIRQLREFGWYVSQKVLDRFVGDFTKPRSDVPFHDFPTPDPWQGSGVVLGMPRDTQKRFSGWKVWLETGEFRMATPSGPIEELPPAWNLQSPSGLMQQIPALGLTLPEFQSRLSAITGDIAASEITEYFQPTERDSPAGNGVFPR